MRPILPTGPDYLLTPLRREGMDHDFYPWRDTWAAPRLDWGQGTKLGVWIQLAVEWFPMNISGQPFLPIGAPNRPWPDSETYTQRDYGLRVGIYRMMEALRARGVPVSAFVNARVAARYPALARAIREEGWEVVAAGLDAGAIHHEGLTEPEERAMIAEALALLRAAGLAPVAWHSPSWSQSTRTPRLLVEAGMTAMADWCNDEAPYVFETGAGPITALPATLDLSDRDIIGLNKNRQHEFGAAILRAGQRLLAEAEASGAGRLLTFNVSPWLMGQPYRIATFERLLDDLFALEGVAPVRIPEILAATRF